MKFSTFKKLKWMFDKLCVYPVHAPPGALYWTKLYYHVLNKRKGMFTTILADGERWSKQIGNVIPIIMEDTEGAHEIFKARIISVNQIERHEISDRLARGDADMSRESFIKMLNFWYKEKDLYKITMQRVK